MKRQNEFGKTQLAEHLEYTANWEDLNLQKSTYQRLQEIAKYIKHATLARSLGHSTKNSSGTGTIAMFAGLRGKDKTLAAAVLASDLNFALYRVDLGRMVSKYIGETEKNLGTIFDAVTDKGTILLFDEADALFGKRSEVKDSHDRYANIEVSHLLQRMKTFQGLIILSSNTMSTLDQSLLNHLDFVIEFSDMGDAQNTI